MVPNEKVGPTLSGSGIHQEFRPSWLPAECLGGFRYGLAFIAVSLVFAVTAAIAETRRPDVVIVMTDDMGYSDLGCFGGEIETPNLDQLARGGLRFTNFYSENMCWVSRAAMLTGIYHRTSMLDSAIHPRCRALPEVLQSSGYQTLMSGKWHLAGKKENVYPNDRGFDSWYGILGGAASFFAPHGLCRDRRNVESEYADPDYYLTHAISDEAVNYIRSSDTDRPLFLYVAYTAAHWPLHALPEDVAAYHGKYAMGWDELRRQRLVRMKELGVVPDGIPLSPRHPDVPAWEDEPHQQWQQRRMEVYAAQITSMDRGIGQIVQALKQHRSLENTLFIYTIDNGGCHVEYTVDRKGPYLPDKTRDGRPMIPGNVPAVMPGPENTYQSYGYGWAGASNTPYRLFKKFDHEGGIHTPMIVHWPARVARPGTVVRQVSHLIDVMPTVLEASKTAWPDGGDFIPMDGDSLIPAINGNPTTGHQQLFFYHSNGQAIRDGGWKLVKVKKGQWELYNLDSDPNELRDLATKYPGRVETLSKKWTAWSEEQNRRQKSGNQSPPLAE